MWWVILAVIVLTVPVFADAATKPYKCTDHYSYAYCVKTGQVKKEEPVAKNSTSTQKRDQIDDIEKEIRKLEILIEDTGKKIFESERKLQTLERAVKTANYEEKKAKLSHSSTPSEDARLRLESAILKLAEAKKNLEDENKTKSDLFKTLDESNKKLAESRQHLKETRLKENPSKQGIQAVSILLDNTCITMIKNNLTSVCPTYEQLMSLNWDTSMSQSGGFSFSDGYFHREPPKVKNDSKLYSMTDYNIFIDPSSDVIKNTKTITISPTLTSYFLADDMKKEDNVRKWHKDRYVDKCRNAIISNTTWKTTLSDTIQYLRGGCTNTLLGIIEQKTDPTTDQAIETSSKYKHDQWVKAAKETYKENMINRDNSTNKSVIEDEDQ